jgi:hypothetical protein
MRDESDWIPWILLLTVNVIEFIPGFKFISLISVSVSSFLSVTD